MNEWNRRNGRNKKLSIGLVAILVLSAILGLMFIPNNQVSATTVTFYSDSDDGNLYHASNNYEYTWNHDTGDFGYIYYSEIGQRFFGGEYYSVKRAFVFFDTSSIPDGVSISSATLSLYGYEDWSDTDFDIVIQNGQPTYPHKPLQEGDYNRTHYSGNGGSISSSSWITSGYNDITLNSNGKSWINKEGWTKLCLRSNRDISGIAPMGDEYVRFYNYEQGTGYRAKLEVTYPFSPSVTTNDATDISGNSAKLNGNLNNMGGASSCDVWFVWDTTSHSNYAYYANSTTHQTKYSTGSFSDTISSLDPGTTYHFRAVASNDAGTSQGSDESFTTLTSPLVETHDATDIDTDSAELWGELTDTGGDDDCEVWFVWDTTSHSSYSDYSNSTSHQILHSSSLFNDTVSSLNPGTTYHFRAVASNGVGTSQGINMSFTTDASETNPPTACFNVSKSDLTVDVDASCSIDNGSIIDYAWDWTNDGSYDSYGETQSHTYSENGTYTIKLKVTDNEMYTDTTTKTVTVEEGGGNGNGNGNGGSSGWGNWWNLDLPYFIIAMIIAIIMIGVGAIAFFMKPEIIGKLGIVAPVSVLMIVIALVLSIFLYYSDLSNYYFYGSIILLVAIIVLTIKHYWRK